MGIYNIIKGKTVGFWVSFGIGTFSSVTAIVYAVCYVGSDYMNWIAFSLTLLCAAASVGMIISKQTRFLPYVQAILCFTALMFFIYGIYYYVSIVVVGIDLTSVDAPFVISASLFVLLAGFGIANIFLNQTKKEQNKQ